MLNQFTIPTWLIVGVPSLILIGILVWFAIVWWRARRDDADDGVSEDGLKGQNWREN